MIIVVCVKGRSLVITAKLGVIVVLAVGILTLAIVSSDGTEMGISVSKRMVLRNCVKEGR